MSIFESMQITKNLSASRLILLFASGVALFFLIAPLTGVFLSLKAPNLFETANDIQVRNSIFRTLAISCLATALSSLFAIPLAYLLARKKFPLKGLLEAIIDIPVVIPHSAAGIALLGFISRDSMVGSLASKAGFTLVGSPVAIGMAMAFVSLPFLINSAKEGFAAVPLRLEHAAATLGASEFTVFTKITLPVASRSVVSGLVLMFARGMSEFGAIVIVAYHPMTTPVMIFDRFNSFGLDYARPVAAIFIAITIVLFIFLRSYQKKR
ncbi:MAG: ABC transporter permease subunit [Bacteroidia bacterium]|jgi:molybdate/tungstate transport system permease protein|nr:ABC transporter permease [Bacteroidales bacterium]MDD3300716.1 ABC transporter permease [Bacteroidales bacterium]MDD3843859.1 ABC transporter permease [Bacteroidales bacterium]MDD4618018.1 ABC transporter permease [Bacteroidales bacterium]NCC45843.1 ABC transporter permease subunit [Bacteroidia bacterium]